MTDHNTLGIPSDDALAGAEAASSVLAAAGIAATDVTTDVVLGWMAQAADVIGEQSADGSRP